MNTTLVTNRIAVALASDPDLTIAAAARVGKVSRNDARAILDYLRSH